MKKIFALILAIVMMASMSVVVFADEVRNDATSTDSDGKLPGGTVLTYGVPEAYIVVIPANQTFGTNASASAEVEGDEFIATAAISASGVKVAGNEKFVLSVASANGWKLVDTNKDAQGNAISRDVTYTATTTVGTDTTAISATNTVVFEVASTTAVAGGTGSATLNFYTAGTGQEGNYQDTLTFIVSMASVTTQG